MKGTRVINPISPTSPGYLLIIYYFTRFRTSARVQSQGSVSAILLVDGTGHRFKISRPPGCIHRTPPDVAYFRFQKTIFGGIFSFIRRQIERKTNL